MLELKHVAVTLSKNTPLATTVLKDLNLSIETGEFVIIVGGNGCGKSTLLNTIAGHVRPDMGKIIIDNQDVTEQACNSRLRDVSLVMQDPRLGTVATMTIFENLNLAYLRGRKPGLALHHTKSRRHMFQEKLQILNMGLENRMDHLVGLLSGGQRQALSLIMAIVADYKIILMDEITAALDPSMAENVMNIAAKIVSEEKRTALMITHNMQHALRYGTKTLLMQNGKILREYNYAARNDMSPVTLAAAIGGVY